MNDTRGLFGQPVADKLTGSQFELPLPAPSKLDEETRALARPDDGETLSIPFIDRRKDKAR